MPADEFELIRRYFSSLGSGPAVALGVGFLYYAIRLYREEQPNAIAMKTFGYSIFYLSLLFAFLLLDHYARVFIRGWFL